MNAFVSVNYNKSSFSDVNNVNIQAIKNEKLLTEKELKKAMKQDESTLVSGLKERFTALKTLDPSVTKVLEKVRILLMTYSIHFCRS